MRQTGSCLLGVQSLVEGAGIEQIITPIVLNTYKQAV